MHISGAAAQCTMFRCFVENEFHYRMYFGKISTGVLKFMEGISTFSILWARGSTFKKKKSRFQLGTPLMSAQRTNTWS